MSSRHPKDETLCSFSLSGEKHEIWDGGCEALYIPLVAPGPIVRHHITVQETGLVQMELKRRREEERGTGMQGTIMAGQDGGGERRGAAKREHVIVEMAQSLA